MSAAPSWPDRYRVSVAYHGCSDCHVGEEFAIKDVVEDAEILGTHYLNRDTAEGICSALNAAYAHGRVAGLDRAAEILAAAKGGTS